MIFKILIRYILGYVNISIQGYYIDRFINICVSKNIFLWNTKIEKMSYAHSNVGVKDFKRLKEVARKTNCRITLNSKKGLPFIMNRYRKRKIFGIFLVIVAVTMFIQSRFIWNIQVDGLSRIQKEEIIQELKEVGLETGTLKSNVNTKEIINQIRLKRDDIAWMNIDLRGTNVIVEIVETTEKPKIIPLDEYCNIVSDKTAQITKITANTGTIVANVGDIVMPRKYTYWWMDGRKVYRNKICSCEWRDRCKSLV